MVIYFEWEHMTCATGTMFQACFRKKNNWGIFYYSSPVNPDFYLYNFAGLSGRKEIYTGSTKKLFFRQMSAQF